MNNPWSELHKKYKDKEWIDTPNLFAKTVLSYFPSSGELLDLGAGQGQDTRFFAHHGLNVTSTDIEDSALEESAKKITEDIKENVTFKKVDLRETLPFKDETFDVVYAHLSLHYFDYQTTLKLFHEINRVLKPRGIFAFFVNSTSDPEYGTGTKIEEDYFHVENKGKRYFSVKSVESLTRDFIPVLLDDQGETYKDREIGVHNLIRFVGTKQLQ